MPQPANPRYLPPHWALPDETDAGVIRQLARGERSDTFAPLPPRRETPLCFQPMVEPELPRDRAGSALAFAAAVCFSWIIVGLIIALIVRTG